MVTMNPNPRELLKQYFGFSEFKPGQEQAISALLAGQSAAAVFPTGGGKSLCYQLPALAFEGITLVVSPLIALMKDQIDALYSRGIAAARLDSSLTADEYREVMENLRSGSVKLLYVSPERFNNERFRGQLKSLQVSLFAVDEAHCISEWGHNFRPDYLKLPGFAREFSAERILALTATATPHVLQDMCRVFDIDATNAVCTGFYRPNLKLLLTPIDARRRDDELVARLKKRDSGPGIVYVTLQKTAVDVAEKLRAAGFDAQHYHGGMKPDERNAVQDWFLKSTDGFVVATIAFGMGVDKPDIRSVYHYNLPKSLENYSQEIGRAGRDGLPSVCELLACTDDLTVLENFIYGDTPTAEAIKSLVEEVFIQEERFDFSQFDICRRHDVRPLVLRTLLTYLELDGFLEAGTPFYSNFQFKPLMPSKEILSRFESERHDFLKSVLARSVKKKTWFQLDVDAAAAALQQPRERIVTALDYLGEQQMLELKIAGVRSVYKRLRKPESEAELVNKLVQQVQQREAREIARLQQVMDLISLDACQVAFLCQHFGQPIEGDCGHCSFCETKTGQEMPARHAAQLNEVELKFVSSAVTDLKDRLPQSAQIARLLCGLSCPAISKERLQKDHRYGTLEEIPYRLVLDAVEAAS